MSDNLGMNVFLRGWEKGACSFWMKTQHVKDPHN